jgi:transcription elongation GreA/GreB family factor
MPYYFLQSDYDELRALVDDVRARIRQASEAAAESAQQSSETWHDNYGFEEHQRQVAMLSQYLENLVKILNEAEIITGVTGEQIGVGSRVTVEDTETGQILNYLIGSYMCLKQLNGHISYVSQIAKILLGAKVGDIRSGSTIAGEKTYRIISVGD